MSKASREEREALSRVNGEEETRLDEWTLETRKVAERHQSTQAFFHRYLLLRC